jgi:CubicO group peptidase (beta-lactamase class C family)
MRTILCVCIILLTASTTDIVAQGSYRPSYQELKEYEGTYEYLNRSRLQIAASPIDTLLYAIIGTSRYKLRPSKPYQFLNNGNQMVQFVTKGSTIIGFKQEGDKQDTTYKLISHKVTFSEKIWTPRQLNGKKFRYQYVVPKQRNDGLTIGTIVNSGLDTSLIHKMMDRIVDGTYPGVHSVLILKKGKLVLEEYFYDNDASKLHELRSASKSFTSALVGIAIDKGLIKDVNAPMVDYLANFPIHAADPRKNQITIQNLLTQQSGFDCYDYDAKSPGNEVKMYPTSNWIKFMLELPMAGDPGNAAAYCSGNVMLLNQIVAQASNTSIHDFARDNLFSKLGIKEFKWDFVPDSTHMDDFGQVHLTSRDMAKFGMLYLNGGKWGGEQIISADYVKESAKKHSNVDGINYGYLWWCEDLTVGGKVFKGYAAKGNGGQRIFIWPDQDMIAIVTAGNYNSQSPANRLLIECVLSGLK